MQQWIFWFIPRTSAAAREEALRQAARREEAERRAAVWRIRNLQRPTDRPL